MDPLWSGDSDQDVPGRMCAHLVFSKKSPHKPPPRGRQPRHDPRRWQRTVKVTRQLLMGKAGPVLPRSQSDILQFQAPRPLTWLTPTCFRVPEIPVGRPWRAAWAPAGMAGSWGQKHPPAWPWLQPPPPSLQPLSPSSLSQMPIAK